MIAPTLPATNRQAVSVGRQAYFSPRRERQVVPLPLPRPLYYRSRRLPASYLNFYIANGVVVAPVFDDPADEIALETLARFFPDRQVLGLLAVDLVWGLGAFHCLSQQEPALA